MRNWKTTLAGIGAIASGVALLTEGKYTEGIAALTAGVGLVFGKDYNVTGKA